MVEQSSQRLKLPLSLQGAEVSASDISGAMADEAKRRYEAAVASGGASSPQTTPKFAAADLESLSGKFHTVCCLDVMIHYPQVWSGAAHDCAAHGVTSISSGRCSEWLLGGGY